jgi:hypothetical protein
MNAERPGYIDHDTEEQTVQITSELTDSLQDFISAQNKLLLVEEKAAKFLVEQGISPIRTSANPIISDFQTELRKVVQKIEELPQ